ncbi:MAG: PCRF domain-containing protein [Bdellovibrionales bacterium]|nr:PCRF domain-containing protein [Bdellovibrionales bacterium]
MKTFLAPLAKLPGTKSPKQSFRPLKKTACTSGFGNVIRIPMILVGLWIVFFLHIGLAQSQNIKSGHESVSCRFFLTGHKPITGEAQLPESTQKLLVQVLVALNEKWKAINDLGIDYRVQLNQLKSRDPEVFFELALLEAFGKIKKEVDDIEKNEVEVRSMEAAILAMTEAQVSNDKANTLQLISMFREEAKAWIDSVRRYWDSILDRLIQLENTWQPEINRDSAYIEISMKDANSDLFVYLLKEMYLSYAEKRKWKTEIISTSEVIHNSASSRSSQGISSIVIKIEGPGVFRALEWESGIHRLMAAMGELRGATVKKGNEEKITTVNVLVTVLPGPSDPTVSVDDKTRFTDEEFLIEPIKKSRGPGGQHVNKTESAVRVIHIHTGIQVVMSTYRSQHQNREVALEIVRAKVKQKQEEQKERARQQRRSDVAKMENTGSAVPFVRSYKRKLGVVVDTRMASIVESQSIDDVLDGNLDPFVAGGRFLSIERILKQLLDRISNQVENAEKRCRSFGVDGCG